MSCAEEIGNCFWSTLYNIISAFRQTNPNYNLNLHRPSIMSANTILDVNFSHEEFDKWVEEETDELISILQKDDWDVWGPNIPEKKKKKKKKKL